MPRDGTQKLRLAVLTPGATAACLQGLAPSLSAQLSASLAVAFYKVRFVVSVAFSCCAIQALPAAQALLLTSLKKKKKRVKSLMYAVQ